MLYEFQCLECKVISEHMVEMGTEEVKCPMCGGKAEKIMSVAAIIMKGYSAKNGYSSATKADKKPGKDSVS